MLKGHVFMNPLSYFISHEEVDALRSDKYEGATYWLQPDKAKLSVKMDGKFQEVPGIIGPIIWLDKREFNVFCMHAVLPHNRSEVFDSRNFKFGDTYTLFTNADEFLRRVRQAAERADHKVSWRLVKYIDPAMYHGPADVFTKDVRFSYQSEFRIVIRPGTTGPRSLRLGDLSDIIVTGDLASINENFKIS